MTEFITQHPILCTLIGVYISVVLWTAKELLNAPEMKDDENDFINK